jgi:hypothetical protein
MSGQFNCLKFQFYFIFEHYDIVNNDIEILPFLSLYLECLTVKPPLPPHQSVRQCPHIHQMNHRKKQSLMAELLATAITKNDPLMNELKEIINEEPSMDRVNEDGTLASNHDLDSSSSDSEDD